MWYISDLKKRAWEVLKKSYWKAFLVSIILAFVGGNSEHGFNFNWIMRNSNNSDIGNSSWPQAYFDRISGLLLGAFIIIFILVFLAVMAFRIFVGYALEVGCRRYFVQAAQEDADLNYLGYSFKKDRYKNIILTMFMRSLYNFLWFLLFIIPGIMKYYAYRMVPYILTDNPNIGYNRAIELSNQMTRGSKFKMWVLDISFIGWYILGLLAFAIGIIFVIPYVNSTNAELYIELRKNAFRNGLSTYKELNIAEL
jgi:hypothetical protein